MVIMKKMWKNNQARRSVSQLLMAVVAILLLGYLSSFVYFRLDLTADKRYTLSEPTRSLLKDLDKQVFIRVYLEGDMPIGLKRMRRSIKEMLDEMRVVAGSRLAYDFVNPSEEKDARLRQEFHNSLMEKGLKPVDVVESKQEGGTDTRRVFPGVIIHYGSKNIAVNLLSNNPVLSSEENLNQSLQALEYKLMHAISSLVADTVKKVAFVEGHGELGYLDVLDITDELARYYEVYRGFIDTQSPNLDEYAVVIVARPTGKFTEEEKFILDQYIMNGGKVLWLIDAVTVNRDSLSTGETTLALVNETNLEDMLFRYGARVNPVLFKDLQCALIPVNTAPAGEQPRFVPAPWPYYPLLAPRKDHPITRNLNFIKAEYSGTIDTVGTSQAVRKTVLLVSSRYARLVRVPSFISLRQIDEKPVQEEYNQSFQTVSLLMEGKFQSVFTHRMTGKYALPPGKTFREQSLPTAMIVVADGDLIRNEVRGRGSNPHPLPLGYDRYMQQTFGNKDFLMNAVNYLTDDAGLMPLRVRELRLLLLDRARIMESGTFWKTSNLVAPVLLVVLFGVLVNIIRKRKYGRPEKFG